MAMAISPQPTSDLGVSVHFGMAWQEPFEGVRADAKRTHSYSSDLHFLGIIMQLSD